VRDLEKEKPWRVVILYPAIYRKGLRKTANTRNAVEVAARMSVELLLETFFLGRNVSNGENL
jgi:hypothetical protein